MRTTKTRRRSTALAAFGLALAAGVAGFGPGGAIASSHREAPLIAADPAVDNTDVYAFVSPDRPGYVTLMANFIPFEEPNGGPNFYPFATDAVYNIKIDNNGDAKPDAVYRWKFHNIDKRGGSTFLYNNGPVTSIADKNLLFRQTYTLQASFNGGPFQTRVSNAPVAPSRVGPASMPDYANLRNQAVTTLPGGWKIFAGQADDPFFLDLRVFDLLYGGNLKEVGQDTLAGYNANTIAIQVPFKDVALNANAKRNPVVGVWSTAERPRVRITGKMTTSTKNWVQVSRLGNPLVNEVVVPAGLKDAFNALPPVKDASVAPVVARVKNPEVPKLIQGIYGIKAPATPRNDLAEIFLTGITTKAGGPIKADLNSQLNNADASPSAFRPSEMLRLNLSVKPTAKPNRLGVLGGDLQGFPNGRRLTDDVVDIELQALEGAAQTGKLVGALADGDGVNANDRAFGKSFPYVALPNVGAVNNGASAVNNTQSAAVALTPPGSAPPAEQSVRAAPVASSSRDTLYAIIAATAGAVAVALAALLIVGWLKRRRRPTAGGASRQDPLPPSTASGPDESPA
ncbi:MAG TPA: DUF4331 domain-containing protein [Streptosporangiaceae bacterium]|nr:DUF4331 domain-containing protein [Streptosporangiaceae bacterium]